MLCKLRYISIAVFLENMELGFNIGCEIGKSPTHRLLSPQGKAFCAPGFRHGNSVYGNGWLGSRFQSGRFAP
ncbi:hypothetical protein BBD42_09750 [Paenibacillus sp. BIHB 4019]|uniref:Uncharacterized protein n=1 Tax=Paenibacillus sp. BIHB 4019 TaxID=1870819 RepID=A0A1B2DG97_9BACL|nr:hypothetical protein BBD42_09750 [Paenibacillus sp. BIHB 4019]